METVNSSVLSFESERMFGPQGRIRIAGRNIENLLNRSRGELAVTLVDVVGEFDAEILGQLRAIDGVLSARAVPA